jgi:hypothetical protein
LKYFQGWLVAVLASLVKALSFECLSFKENLIILFSVFLLSLTIIFGIEIGFGRRISC